MCYAPYRPPPAYRLGSVVREALQRHTLEQRGRVEQLLLVVSMSIVSMSVGGEWVSIEAPDFK